MNLCDEQKVISVVDDGDSSLYEVKAGSLDLIEMSFSEMGPAGYVWTIDEERSDKDHGAMLFTVKSSQDRQGEMVIGAPHDVKLKVYAPAIDEKVIYLSYGRPWKKEPERVVEILISV